MIKVIVKDSTIIDKPYEFVDENGNKKAGSTRLQTCTFCYGDYQTPGVLPIPAGGRGYPIGHYEMCPESFSVEKGRLLLQKYLILKQVSK